MVQISWRIERIEETLAVEREKMRKPLTEHLQNSRALARDHATAVSAIVLAGQPQIEEPLGQAWARALQHYGVDRNQKGQLDEPLFQPWQREFARKFRYYHVGLNHKGQLDEQTEAARQLGPKIMGSKKESTRFTDIFRAAPVWLLQFTGMAWDASLLKFQLPDLGQTLSWGCAGYEEARRWPLLPSGIMEDGVRIPRNDERWMWITVFCGTTIPILDEPTLFQAYEEYHSFQGDEEYRSHPLGRILDGLRLILDVASNPERKLSRYEERLLRTAIDWIEKGAKIKELGRNFFLKEGWLPGSGVTRRSKPRASAP